MQHSLVDYLQSESVAFALCLLLQHIIKNIQPSLNRMEDVARRAEKLTDQVIRTYSSFVENQITKYALDCYITFECDEHLNDEFVGTNDRRVYELCGFSEGIAVTSSEPCLITSPMNSSQAKEASRYSVYEGRISDYLVEKGYSRISFSRKYISHNRYVELIKKLKEKNPSIEFIVTDEDDEVERPTNSEIIYLEGKNIEDYITYKEDTVILEYLNSHNFSYDVSNLSGLSYKNKIEMLKEKCKTEGVKWMIVTELDTICWILNVRGNDIAHFPVIYAYLAISPERSIVFSNTTLKLEGVEEQRYKNFSPFLQSISNDPVLIGGECSEWIYSQLTSPKFTSEASDLKAIKNDTELYGMALSYIYDSLAITELFGYMESCSNYTEADILRKMEEIRSKHPGYICPSFETICATGKNAANIHNKTSSQVVDKRKVFLLDTGSHYIFGTTDTSRTVLLDESCLGEHKDLIHDATLVLKGHINGMMKKYSKDDNYSQIDKEARKFLSSEGKDFAHATGHGVGHCLNVHEQPPIITTRDTSLIRPRHLFSVEPGYYVEGKYGIRFENLVYTKQSDDGSIKCINLTMVPYQRALIDVSMLTDDEKRYLNDHHAACYNLLSKHCSPDALRWLTKNTARID